MVNFVHLSRSTFVRSHCFLTRNSSQGFEVRAWAHQVHPHVALCTDAQSCWNRMPCPNCSHKVGSMELSNISLYAQAAVRGPFYGIKGPTPVSEGNPPHTTTKLYTCCQTSTVLLAADKPRLVHQIDRWSSTYSCS